MSAPLVVIRRDPATKLWVVRSKALGVIASRCPSWGYAIRYANAWLCRMHREGTEAAARIAARNAERRPATSR